MKPPTWLFLFLTAAVPALCGQDIDMRVGAGGGEGGRTLSTWAPAVVLQYRGAFPLPKSFAVLVNEEFTGLFKTAAALPRPEINYPVVSVTTAGIAYGGYGTVQIRGFSQYLSQAAAIKFPISAAQNSPYHDALMTQRFKNGADCFLDIPFWRFRLIADGLFNDLIFDCDTVFSKTDSSLVRRLRTGCHDADVWGKAALAFDVFEKKLWLKGAACIKNDLNQYTGYNIEEYFAGLEGNTTVFSNMLDVNGDAFARYYQSDIMALNGFNTWFGTIGHLRLVAKIPSNFFIKGDCAFETGTTMRKFRGQLCVRKAWLNRSALEAGFWSTGGGLFSRQCGYLSSTITVSPRDMITPCMRVYSHWNGFLAGSDSGMVVYRSDVGMAFRHDFSLSTMSVLRNLTFNCGASYRWITSMPATVPVNPQNLDLYVGLSDWL